MRSTIRETSTGRLASSARIASTSRAGVLTGELTPECAAAVQAVLGALSSRCGPEDDRTQDQRLHDGLYDAMRRLLGSELLPKKNSHSTQAVVHIGLADLLALPGASPLQLDWTARLAARWVGMRAASSEDHGGDGAAWITGPAARGITCDAALFPVVTGDPDLGVLDELVRLCVDLDACLHGGSSGSGETAPGQDTWATEPHHVTHRADHGPTAVENLYDLCYYHHHILVHQKGWTIKTRPDGTLEATSPDGRVFTEHTRPPPPRRGDPPRPRKPEPVTHGAQPRVRALCAQRRSRFASALSMSRIAAAIASMVSAVAG